MAFTLGVDPTATVPATGARSFSPEPINYNADWRVIKEVPNEVVLSNIKAPLASPEQFRVAFTEVADVFKGSKIEPADSAAVYADVIKRGASILCQLNGTYTSDADPTNRFPYSAHLVLKVPYGPNPVYSEIMDIIEKLLGHLYETSDTTIENRVSAFLRGSLTPGDI